ncbi:unnamed protein product [Ranitomeya imitator]|uniref:Uncharacterized protein n=1 Tax=Ranitomeya imitator TaxID=111125 RepID=A0ABN9M438_9NEOB|nr:unnamed protein product [Ranitomeya imitator]
MTLQGHEDYIHCLSLREQQRECACLAVRTARSGYLRTGSQTHKIEMYKYEECARGRSTQVDQLRLWWGPHVIIMAPPLRHPTTIFPIMESQQQVMFYQDMILSAGQAPHINHCQITGDIRAQIPSSPCSIYSLSINESSPENKVLTAAGSSSKIDVFTNFRYRAFSLSFT